MSGGAYCPGSRRSQARCSVPSRSAAASAPGDEDEQSGGSGKGETSGSAHGWFIAPSRAGESVPLIDASWRLRRFCGRLKVDQLLARLDALPADALGEVGEVLGEFVSRIAASPNATSGRWRTAYRD